MSGKASLSNGGTVQELEKRIAEIEARNRAVEGEKAWETSGLRRMLISLTTYLVATLFLISAGFPSPWLSALVPMGGYLLSTLSLPWVKQWWMTRRSLKH